jgi:glycerate kinase
MKVVIAIDSFKGSLTSIEAGIAAAEGFKRADKRIECKVKPLADGGEGTVEALVAGMGGNLVSLQVTGPLGEKIESRYGIIEEKKLAVIEMSSAAGITLVPKEKLNPMKTTTYGVGEIIKDAIGKGSRSFIIGIGGSSTNDGGAGMLQALGFDLKDKEGKNISYGAEGLSRLAEISDKNVLKEIKECSFKVACDVNNPLCGEKGCSRVFAPQKGADSKMIEKMDAYLKKYAEIAKESFEEADPDYPGAGAAGGLGFAFKSFLGAELTPGIDLVIKETNLEEEIREADLVITGEGKLDAQTSMGKAPVGVAKIAKKYGKRVIAFAGAVTEDARKCNEKGIDAFFPIVRGITTIEEALEKETARRNLEETAEQVARLIIASRT